MYQLKIDKDTDKLALQHFNAVKDRLLKDINHFLAGKTRKLNKKELSINGDNNIKRLLTYLANEDNLKKVIVSHPDKLRKFISTLPCDAFDSSMMMNRILYHIFICFGYDDKVFEINTFYKQIHIETCPYCNTVNIHYAPATINASSEKGELDHFYPKDIYPILGLSFYNLIPSCSICNNTQHKASNDVTRTRQDYSLRSMHIINPYEYCDVNYFFSFNLRSHWESANSNDIDILTDGDKQAGYNSLLKLKSRYNTEYNRNIALSIIRKVNRKPASYFDYLKRLPIPQSLLVEELDEWGFYLRRNEVFKAPFNKFKLDIFEKAHNI